MRKKFDISPDGRIEELRVIGFHGEVDFAQTPARREPVFADEDGRLIGLEEPAPSARGAAVTAVWGRVGARADSNPPPGIFTLLPCPHPASWGSLVVIVGEAELKHAVALLDARRGDERGRTRDFLSWLGSGAGTPGSLDAQWVGTGAVWYCSLEEAASLYRIISRAAEQLMLHASSANDDATLYRSSWWLSRAAMDDSDRYFAAVGLERSERRMADAYLKATFRKRAPEEIEARLKHARGVFEERRVDALRKEKGFDLPRVELEPPAHQPSMGNSNMSRDPFARSRSNVRRLASSAPGQAA